MKLNLVRGPLEDRAARSAFGRASERFWSRTPRREFLLEVLEDRRLPAALLPDLALTSATTSDSRSVTFEYDVTRGVPSAPVRFGVYRSADDRFDSGDLPIGSMQVLPPGQGSPTLDGVGRPALAPGHHRLTVSLADGLPPDPSRPYVLVVADPDNVIPESNEANNTASFRTHVVGVISHGGIQPKGWTQGPPWERRMAAQLRDEGYDAVIAFNWVYDSHHPGAAARQGQRLAALVAEAASRFPSGDPVDVHFIGHSEGAVVNSQAILRLNQSGWPPNMQAGYLKVTMLDPHAANNSVPGQQYSVSHGFLGWIARQAINDFQSRAKDPAVVVPDNVDDAEVFYQHTPVAQTHTTNHGIYNLWGQVPVHGPAHYFNLTAPGISHSGKFGVQDWYRLNIVPTLGEGAPEIRAITLTGAQSQSAGSAQSRSLRVPNSHQPQYTGTAAPGATVRLFAALAGTRELAPIGRATAGSDGGWNLTTRPLAAGRYRVVAVSNVPAGPTRRSLHVRPTAWMDPLTIPADRPKF